MAITFVQRVVIVSSVANQTTTGAVGGTFTAGNLLVAIVGWSSSVAAPTSINVPSGWTAPLASIANGAPNGIARGYYLANNAGGAQTWTWTLTPGSATAQSWGVEILEFAGAATSSPLDLTAVQAATGASSSVSLDTTAASGTTASGDVLVQVVAIDRSAAGTETSSASSVPTSGWSVLAVTTSTNGVPNVSVSGQYQILTGTQASPRGIITSSISESSESILMTFLVAASGTTITPPSQAIAITMATSSLDNNVVPGGQALTTSLQTPSLDMNLAPASQAVVITMSTPTLSNTINTIITPPSQAVVLSLQTPALGFTLVPASQAVLVALSAPSLGSAVFPGSQSLALVMQTPTVAVGGPPATGELPGYIKMAMYPAPQGFGFPFSPYTPPK